MAGGWTGGHVFPIRSLLEFLNAHSSYDAHIQKLYRFGSKNSLEAKTCKDLQEHDTQHKLQFVALSSWKYRRESYRKSKLKNIPDFFCFLFGFFQSIYRLLFHRIDVVFCKGGYVALPVVFAAALLRRKIVVHESDTRSGLVNRIASRFAKKTFTGFDGVLPNSQTIGQLLSDDIIIETHPEFNARTLLLVVGGSQGSKRLYQSLLNIIETTPDLQEHYEFFFVLGFANEEMLPQFDKFHHVHAYGFLSQKEMGELYNICDIAITRGGTTALAEQNLYDMKQIIVPIPRTHDQYENAKRYAKHHNDLRLNQRDDNFEQQLKTTILSSKGFKKVRQQKDKKAIIAHAKKAVRDSLIA